MTSWVELNAWWKSAAAHMYGMSASTLRTARIWVEVDEQVRQLCRRLAVLETVAPGDREDLVQWLLQKLQKRRLLNRLRRVEAPAHYLFSMLAHEVCRQAKRRRREMRACRGYVESLDAIDDQRPDAILDWQEQCERAVDAMKALRPGDHRILVLFYWKRFSVRRISRRLNRSEVAVLQRLHRARRRLRAALESAEDN